MTPLGISGYWFKIDPKYTDKPSYLFLCVPLSKSLKVSGSHFPYFSRVRLGFTRVRVPRTLPALILMHLAESWQKNPQIRSHTFTVGGPLKTSPFIFPFSSNPTLTPVGTPFFLATYSGFSLSCLYESCCCSMVCVYLQRNTCSCVSIICSLICICHQTFKIYEGKKYACLFVAS